ncbi:MAG: sulfur carrier protein ThiS adenylyltransferase ThiF [Actinomycetota bacterium]|jgi:sulfur carrier protein ThiS adenylyltransferase|nr:sulfur carrier protein ThiS adenylyltransferase ThiF [Actinomycetota bacterium]
MNIDAVSDSGEPMIPQAELRDHLASKAVTILGCGGLGSNCAVMLVRAGVRTLTLVDFDVVEAANLNRQEFFIDQVGMPKVDALATTLRRIDADLNLRLIRDRIDADDLLSMVSGADAIVEAVDSVETKTLILNVCGRELPDAPIVSVSGIAGYASANEITTSRIAQNLWVVGDLESDVRDGHSLVSSRVMTAAAHQAHAVIRILLGYFPSG